MTNCSLEKFKAWLKEKPERQENQNIEWTGFTQVISQLGIEGYLNSAYYQKIQPRVRKWKAEIDQKKERAKGGK